MFLYCFSFCLLSIPQLFSIAVFIHDCLFFVACLFLFCFRYYLFIAVVCLLSVVCSLSSTYFAISFVFNLEVFKPSFVSLSLSLSLCLFLSILFHFALPIIMHLIIYHLSLSNLGCCSFFLIFVLLAFLYPFHFSYFC